MRAPDYFLCFVLSLVLCLEVKAQDDHFCGIRNTSTGDGELIGYTVYYALAGVYVHAGDAVFVNRLEKLNGHTVYHVVGDGQTNPSYEWIYKVRDHYESLIDTADMLPVKFFRDVHDGNVKRVEHISFNRTANTATTDSGNFKVPACIQDVMSAIYYARNIDFGKYKPGDKIPFSMFLDYGVHELYMRYLGKETVKTRFGKFSAIKFKPLLVAGTIFTGGEDMTVWVTDDANHLPIRIESPILVGKIKVDMTAYANLRHPLTSLIKK